MKFAFAYLISNLVFSTLVSAAPAADSKTTAESNLSVQQQADQENKTLEVPVLRKGQAAPASLKPYAESHLTLENSYVSPLARTYKHVLSVGFSNYKAFAKSDAESGLNYSYGSNESKPSLDLQYGILNLRDKWNWGFGVDFGYGYQKQDIVLNTTSDSVSVSRFRYGVFGEADFPLPAHRALQLQTKLGVSQTLISSSSSKSVLRNSETENQSYVGIGALYELAAARVNAGYRSFQPLNNNENLDLADGGLEFGIGVVW